MLFYYYGSGRKDRCFWRFQNIL